MDILPRLPQSAGIRDGGLGELVDEVDGARVIRASERAHDFLIARATS